MGFVFERIVTCREKGMLTQGRLPDMPDIEYRLLIQVFEKF